MILLQVECCDGCVVRECLSPFNPNATFEQHEARDAGVERNAVDFCDADARMIAIECHFVDLPKKV